MSGPNPTLDPNAAPEADESQENEILEQAQDFFTRQTISEELGEILDDKRLAKVRFESETGVELTSEMEDKFNEILDREKVQREEDSVVEAERIAQESGDREVGQGMVESLKNMTSLKDRFRALTATDRDGLKTKVDQYNPLIETFTDREQKLIEGLGHLPDIRAQMEQERERYEEGKKVYEEGAFYSPRAYDDKLKEFEIALDRHNEQVAEAISIVEGKTLDRDVPELEKKKYSKKEFHDALYDAKVFNFPDETRKNPKVRAAIKKRKGELFKEFNDARKEFITTAKALRKEKIEQHSKTIESTDLPRDIDGSQKLDRNAIQERMDQEFQRAGFPEELQKSLKKVWDKQIDRWEQQYIERRETYNTEKHSRLKGEIESIGLPNDLDGSENLSRSDFAAHMESYFQQIQMSPATREKMMDTWESHIDTLYGQYQRLVDEGSKEKEKEGKNFDTQLGALSSDSIDFDTKLTLTDFTKKMQGDKKMEFTDKEQEKKYTERMKELHTGWLKDREKAIKEATSQIQKAKLPKGLEAGMDEKQFLAALGQNPYGLSARVIGASEIQKLIATRDKQLLADYQKQGTEEANEQAEETREFISASIEMFGRRATTGEETYETFADFEAAFLKAHPKLIKDYQADKTLRNELEIQFLSLPQDTQKTEQQTETTAATILDTKKLDEDITTFTEGIPENQTFTDQAAFQKAFLDAHPDYTPGETMDPKITEALKKAFQTLHEDSEENETQKQAGSFLGEDGEINWEGIDLGQANEATTQKRWELLQSDAQVKRSLDIVMRDHPAVGQFMIQSLGSLQSEGDFHQLQLSLRKAPIGTSSHEQMREWLDTFTQGVDMTRFRSLNTSAYTQIRKYCVQTLQWNPDELIGSNEQETDQETNEEASEEANDVIQDGVEDEGIPTEVEETNGEIQEDILQVEDVTEDVTEDPSEEEVMGEDEAEVVGEEDEELTEDVEFDVVLDEEVVMEEELEEELDDTGTLAEDIDADQEEFEGAMSDELGTTDEDEMEEADEQVEEAEEEVKEGDELQSEGADEVAKEDEEMDEETEPTNEQDEEMDEQAEEKQEGINEEKEVLESSEDEKGLLEEPLELLQEDLEAQDEDEESHEEGELILEDNSHFITERLEASEEDLKLADVFAEESEEPEHFESEESEEGLLDEPEEGIDAAQMLEEAEGLAEELLSRGEEKEAEEITDEQEVQGVEMNVEGEDAETVGAQVEGEEGLVEDVSEDLGEMAEAEEEMLEDETLSEEDVEDLSDQLDEVEADVRDGVGISEEVTEEDKEQIEEVVVDLEESKEKEEDVEAELLAQKEKEEEEKKAQEKQDIIDRQQAESDAEKAEEKEKKERISVRERERYALKQNLEQLISQLLRESHNPAAANRIIVQMNILAVKYGGRSALEAALRAIDPQLLELLRGNVSQYYARGSKEAHVFPRVYRESYLPRSMVTVAQLFASIQNYAPYSPAANIHTTLPPAVASIQISKDTSDLIFDQIIASIHTHGADEEVHLSASNAGASLAVGGQTFFYAFGELVMKAA